MNKKRIGALLIGATLLVGALGSFAYFNDKTNIMGSNGTGNLQALEITNGKVVVTAKVTGNASSASNWSYDVAKLSTDMNKNLEDGIQYKNLNNEDLTEDIITFENKHRSPDINVDEGQKDNSAGGNLKRAKIGAELPTKIEYTRPGDAIVLGVTDPETRKTGVVVTNESNLTVKMQLVVKNNNEAGAIINAMTAAGWEMYIDGTKVALNKGEKFDLNVVAPEGTVMLPEVRFELPLKTGNQHQGNDTKGNNGEITSLDLSQLIEIQATQENNGGWNEDGTGDRITK